MPAGLAQDHQIRNASGPLIPQEEIQSTMQKIRNAMTEAGVTYGDTPYDILLDIATNPGQTPMEKYIDLWGTDLLKDEELIGEKDGYPTVSENVAAIILYIDQNEAAEKELRDGIEW